MLAIVVSRADDASTHIGEQLRDLAEWEVRYDDSRPDDTGGGDVWATDGARLREFEARHLDLERPADAFADPDLLVFASKHAGDTGPLLTAHHTGNFGPADHGGAPNSLARACPNAHTRVLDALATHAPDGYDVGMEATHHGPTDVGAPSMFVEVGSAQAEWDDSDAARAVARAILDLRGVATDREPEAAGAGDAGRRHLVGVGGGHYAPRFERIARETDWAVGHVAPDWGLVALGDPDTETGRRVLGDLFAQSRAAYAVVDGDHEAHRAVVEDLGYRVVGETWVRETDDVPLALVARLEEQVAPVSAGLRFGRRAAGYDGEVAVESLSEALLDAVNGIDQAKTLAAVADSAVAFLTDQDGSRVVGPVVVPADTSLAPLFDALGDVLRERYDAVEQREDAFVVRERAFDPNLASDHGVPEGPAFGRLANGETVTVDDERVTPADVTRERETTMPLR